MEASDLGAAIEVVGSFVASFDPARYSVADASVLLGRFARLKRLAATGEALCATRAAEGNAAAAQGHPTPARWLSELTGESVGQAADTLSLGAAFTSHPALEEACRHGQLSHHKARLVAEAARVNPTAEDELVTGARTDTLRQVKDRCARAKAEARSSQDAEAAYEAISSSRYCRTWTDRDGAFRLDARLTPDAGAQVLAFLTAESDGRFVRAQKAGVRLTPDATRADALVALVNGSAGVGDHHDDGGAGPAARRRSVPPKPLVTLRVDWAALRRGRLEPGELCEIPGVGPIPLARARALMGDAITHLVITRGVDVTTVAHLGRSIPAHLRTALVERDRTCVVPGCDLSLGLEIDHWETPFSEGGPASMANLVRICGHHHRLRHHHGFTLSGAPGRWRWDPPDTDHPPDTDQPDTPDTDPPLFSLEE